MEEQFTDQLTKSCASNELRKNIYLGNSRFYTKIKLTGDSVSTTDEFYPMLFHPIINIHIANNKLIFLTQDSFLYIFYLQISPFLD